MKNVRKTRAVTELHFVRQKIAALFPIFELTMKNDYTNTYRYTLHDNSYFFRNLVLVDAGCVKNTKVKKFEKVLHHTGEISEEGKKTKHLPTIYYHQTIRPLGTVCLLLYRYSTLITKTVHEAEGRCSVSSLNFQVKFRNFGSIHDHAFGKCLV